VISEGDCLKQVVKGKYLNSPVEQGKISDHMVKDVITIDPELDVFQAARKFLDLRIRRFPVLQEGKLVGQISQKDIMKAVMKMKTTHW
jgi:CBS domain-containing protein